MRPPTRLAALLPGPVSALLCGSLLLAAAPPASAVDHHRPRHSSDGVRGPVAPQLTARQSARLPVPVVQSSFDVAPGVRFSRWSVDDLRGPVVAHLLDIDPAVPGVRLDYASAPHVAATMPVRWMVRRSGAVAGVNGDFFDIGDTGAPLGMGRDLRRGVAHGPREGWNSAFYLDARGLPHIGEVAMRARVRGRPDLRITGVNTPEVDRGGIGLYTPRWGSLHRYRVVDGQRRQVRMVVVRRGRVARNTRTFPRRLDLARTGTRVLVARGPSAATLRSLNRGSRVRVGTWMSRRPGMVISGNRFLLQAGRTTVVDDREMHPRTAVGIDRDNGHVLLLVVDGRSTASRGHTMVELARLMQAFGAEDALNLDGGGSSTMVARRTDLRLGVMNVPSDGVQRWVPNGLQVFYQPPRG